MTISISGVYPHCEMLLSLRPVCSLQRQIDRDARAGEEYLQTDVLQTSDLPVQHCSGVCLQSCSGQYPADALPAVWSAVASAAHTV